MVDSHTYVLTDVERDIFSIQQSSNMQTMLASPWV